LIDNGATRSFIDPLPFNTPGFPSVVARFQFSAVIDDDEDDRTRAISA